MGWGEASRKREPIRGSLLQPRKTRKMLTISNLEDLEAYLSGSKIMLQKVHQIREFVEDAP